jgi:hypothetical protein
MDAEERHIDTLAVLKNEDQKQQEYEGEDHSRYPEAASSRARQRQPIWRPAHAVVLDVVPAVRCRRFSMILRRGHYNRRLSD